MPPTPIILPRMLIFVASIWLIGSWMITIGFVPPVHPSSATYEPGVRLMLTCLTAGVMIGWPLLRLSQSSPPAPVRQTLLDLLVLISMIQIVLWPLRLVTRWSLARTAAIDATLVGWMIIAGAIVAAATLSSRPSPRRPLLRSLAMVACLALGLLGPMLAGFGFGGTFLQPSLLELSPFLAIRTLGDGGGAPLTILQWRWLILLGVAGCLCWIALGLSRRMIRTEPPSGPPPPPEPPDCGPLQA